MSHPFPKAVDRAAVEFFAGVLLVIARVAAGKADDIPDVARLVGPNARAARGGGPRLETAPFRGPRTIRFTCFGKTDVGRRRELNEDTFYYSDKDGFAVVADGMGGRDFGEVASSLCVSTLNKSFKKYFPETLRGQSLRDDEVIANVVRQTLDTWVRDMNVVVYEFGSLDHRYREMGTTLALVFHQEDFVAVAHVGDSRVYRIRDGKMEQLTSDHSLLNDYIKMKRLSEEEIENFPLKNVIVRALGMKPTVKVDTLLDRPEIGDVYVLCSDGLCGPVTDPDIQRIVTGQPDLQTAANRLIEAANESGGPDNITVVLAKVMGLS